MRVLVSAKWLALTVLVVGCAREAPPAPVFDRMLALLQPDPQPLSTVALRDQLKRDVPTDAVEIRSLDQQTPQSVSSAPLPRVKIKPIQTENDDRSVRFGQETGTQLASLQTDDRPGSYHQVAHGDTLYNISRRYQTDVKTIAELNNIRPPYTISLGQRIALPYVPPAPQLASARPLPNNVVVIRRTAPGQVTAAPPVAASPTPAPVSAAPRKLVAASLPRNKPPAPRRIAERPVSVSAPPPRTGGFAWPVQGRVLVGYGPTSGGLHNDGLNIAAPLQAPVRAAENGVVAYAGNEIRGFGKLVLIKHDGDLITAYGHNSDLLVRRGDIVQKGQVIARVGATGGVDVPQLHFEIREGRKAIDPRKLLPARDV